MFAARRSRSFIARPRALVRHFFRDDEIDIVHRGFIQARLPHGNGSAK
jgi:hypothetical protein